MGRHGSVVGRAIAVVALVFVAGAGLVGAPPAGAGGTVPTGTVMAFDPVVDGQIFALAYQDGVVYGAGSFTAVQTDHGVVAQPYVAAWDYETGDLLTRFRPVLDAEARALAMASDGRVLVGGAFTSVAHGTAQSLGTFASLDPETGRPRISVPQVRGQVWAITVADRYVYLGGNITRVGTVSAAGVVRIRYPGLVDDTAFRPAISEGKVKAIYADDHTVIVGGNFKKVEGRSAGRFLAPLDRVTGALVAGYRNEAPFEVFDFSLLIDAGSPENDRIVTANGGAGGRVQVRRIDDPGRLAAETLGNGDAQAVLVRGEEIWIGGHWTTVQGTGIDCRKLIVWGESRYYCGQEFRGGLGIWDMLAVGRDDVIVAGDLDKVGTTVAGGPVRITLPPF